MRLSRVRRYIVFEKPILHFIAEISENFVNIVVAFVLQVVIITNAFLEMEFQK